MQNFIAGINIRLIWLVMQSEYAVAALFVFAGVFCFYQYATLPGFSNSGVGCCARCGRSLHSAITFDCPGCGVDVREGGITEAQAGKSGGGRLYLAIGLLCLVVGVGQLVIRVLFRGRMSRP